MTITSDASTIRSRSASGTPIMSEIVISGSRLAISETKLPPPVGAASETIVWASRRMPSSIRAIWRGVNADEMIPRSFVWRGESMPMIDSVASRSSSGTSPNDTPSPEQNVSGLRDALRMSS